MKSSVGRSEGALADDMRRGTYARALEQMTEVLLTETDTTRVLDAVARITGETLRADRALIYDVRFGEQLAIGLTEWLNPAVQVSATKATYSLSNFAASVGEVRSRRSWFESHKSAPHPALYVDGSAAVFHEQMSIESLLWFPFDFSSDGYYVLVFNQVTHQRTWEPHALEFLRIATRYAYLALMQMKMTAEQAESQRALVEAQKAESIALLAGGVAHDFNNLLGIVLGAVGRARALLGTDTPIAASLRDAERAAREAADLAKHLLAYAGRGQFVIETVDLAALVDEMRDLVRAATGPVRLRFTSESPCPVRGDAAQLRQILMNFVVNAAEAIDDPKSGEISVSVTRDPSAGDPKVILEVRDNGRGISPEVRARIFEPFFTTKALGRGLGLAAVSGIVRSHGGELRVHSGEGSGTTVTVLLPAVSMIEAQQVPAACKPPEGGTTVLVVDDSNNFRRMCSCILGDFGYQTIEASNGAEALQHLGSGELPVDIVLLDWTMPHPGGAETFRRLRERWTSLPVVIMSGYAEESAVGLLRDIHTAFIEKPFTPEALDAVLRDSFAKP
jgi:signal transduction histidine kinase